MFYFYRNVEIKENENNEENEEHPKDYDSKLKRNPEKILKIAFAIFLFIIAFGSGFIGRITLHILIWHINPPMETPISVINTLGGLLEPNCSICTNDTSCTSKRNYIAVDESWIWALFLVIIAPYCFTFMSTFFKICFKSNKKLNWKVLVAVSLNKNSITIIYVILCHTGHIQWSVLLRRNDFS